MQPPQVVICKCFIQFPQYEMTKRIRVVNDSKIRTHPVQWRNLGKLIQPTSRQWKRANVYVFAPAENEFYAHLRSERSHLEHLFQYQLVRSCGVLENQMHFQGPSDTDSRTFKDHVCFQGLSSHENLEKIQGFSSTRKSPVVIAVRVCRASDHESWPWRLES